MAYSLTKKLSRYYQRQTNLSVVIYKTTRGVNFTPLAIIKKKNAMQLWFFAPLKRMAFFADLISFQVAMKLAS
jgi:hypothetical protein